MEQVSLWEVLEDQFDQQLKYQKKVAKRFRAEKVEDNADSQDRE